MIKIKIPENEVGIRIFTEEVPDLKELPKDARDNPYRHLAPLYFAIPARA